MTEHEKQRLQECNRSLQLEAGDRELFGRDRAKEVVVLSARPAVRRQPLRTEPRLQLARIPSGEIADPPKAQGVESLAQLPRDRERDER